MLGNLYAMRILACLINDPAICKEFQTDVPYFTELTCAKHGHLVAAVWLSQNYPKFAISRVECPPTARKI